MIIETLGIISNHGKILKTMGMISFGYPGDSFSKPWECFWIIYPGDGFETLGMIFETLVMVLETMGIVSETLGMILETLGMVICRSFHNKCAVIASYHHSYHHSFHDLRARSALKPKK